MENIPTEGVLSVIIFDHAAMLTKLYRVKSLKFISERAYFQRTICCLMNNKDWIPREELRLTSPSGLPGSGAGKGGGAGGSVRESGGRLGEYGAAQEEHYFFNKQKEQLEKIKKKLKSDKPGEMSQKEEK